MNLIFLGAPGSGKGTNSEGIKNVLMIPSVSTGDMIRAILKSGEPLGKELEVYVKEGLLVPDELIIKLIKHRISDDDCKNGFILDGFPRTLEQALKLENLGVNIDFVINLEVPNEVIFSRMEGRRVCQECGSVFNIFTDMKPKVEGICDSCHGNLETREDDKFETIKKRLEVYEVKTAPLIEFYEKRKKLLRVDGTLPRSQVRDIILKAVG